MDHRRINRRAWRHMVAGGSRWTVPVSRSEIASARAGDWPILLTPQVPAPRGWFPADMACDLLCLAGGGGQQGPLLAAAGARVTVLDLCPEQLAQDRLVAEREDLPLQTIEGDMAQVGCADECFDVIVHPVSNCFVPDILAVWREAYRLLRPGGVLLSGFMNPVFYLFDMDAMDRHGRLEVRHRLPYDDATGLTPAEWRAHQDAHETLEYSHTLTTQIGGQCGAGFQICDLFEDDFGPDIPCPLSSHMPSMLATLARKPA